MIDQRKAYCRNCRTQTLHNRFRWQGLWGFQLLFSFGGCWLCWPILVPVGLLVAVADLLRPYRCAVCGRRNWRRGDRGAGEQRSGGAGEKRRE